MPIDPPSNRQQIYKKLRSIPNCTQSYLKVLQNTHELVCHYYPGGGWVADIISIKANLSSNSTELANWNSAWQ